MGGLIFAKPNVILIMADDLGMEGLGCYGGESYETPHLDALAEGGLRFTHAYSQPLCTPTRIEIMTGKENHRNWQYFGVLRQGEETFGHLMQGLGYKTCIAGKWQLTSYDPPVFPGAEKRRGTGMHPKEAGFDEYCLFHAEHTEDKGSRYANPTYLRNGELVKDEEGKYGEDVSVEFLLDFLKRHREEEMFVYYPMALPHGPFVPTPDSEEWEEPGKRLKGGVEYFPDMVEYMDTLVGRIVEGVEELGLREETLILFYSDNGTPREAMSVFRGERVVGGKNRVMQTGIRVPLIASWPGTVEAGVSGDLVEAADFVPTLVELGGGDVEEDWDGMSFVDVLKGGVGKREWAFFWYDPRPGIGKESFGRSIFALDKEYKLFSDGRFFDVAGEGFREVELEELTEEEVRRKAKLADVIEEMMAGPMSEEAKVEVDAFGEVIRNRP
ncbi:MAG: sulfatase-like hydrolase/transferase [Verrucomicrobiota bacterium]